MGDLLRILEAVDAGVDVENYPRAMFKASLELGEHQRERTHTQPETERQVPGQQQGADGQEGMAKPGTGQHQQGQEEEEAQRRRQFPEGPRPKRPDPNSPAYRGWDVLDSLTVEQCAVRPPGLRRETGTVVEIVGGKGAYGA